MAINNVIKIKNSTVQGKKPQPAQLQKAELAINLVDKKIYTKDQNNDIIELGGNVSATVDDILDGTSPEKYVNGPELRKVITKEKVADIDLKQPFDFDTPIGTSWVFFSGKEILKSRNYKVTFNKVEQTGTLNVGDTLEQVIDKIADTAFAVSKVVNTGGMTFVCTGVILKGKKGQTLAQFISTNVDRLNNDPNLSQFITFSGTADTFTLTAKSPHVLVPFAGRQPNTVSVEKNHPPQRTGSTANDSKNTVFFKPTWTKNSYSIQLKNDCIEDFEMFFNFSIQGFYNMIGFGYVHNTKEGKIELDPVGEDFIVSLNSDGEVDESILPDLFTKDNNAFGTGQRSWLSPNSISNIVFKTYYEDRTYYVNPNVYVLLKAAGNKNADLISPAGDQKYPFKTEKHALDIISDYFVRFDVTVTIDATNGASAATYKYVYPNTVIAPRSDFTTANSPLNQSKFSKNGITAVDDTGSTWVYTKGAWKENIDGDAVYAKKGEGLKATSLTQTAYDALGTKDPNTLYLITGP